MSADFWNNLRYHLGLTANRPPFGRFTYAEKVEYWALVVGHSCHGGHRCDALGRDHGRQLGPRWWLDVATAIHFYEAVLATLAIVVWHFYQVFFDPDAYPMNWAWWDGQLPLDHYQAEHPLDLESVLEAGQAPGKKNQRTKTRPVKKIPILSKRNRRRTKMAADEPTRRKAKLGFAVTPPAAQPHQHGRHSFVHRQHGQHFSFFPDRLDRRTAQSLHRNSGLHGCAGVLVVRIVVDCVGGMARTAEKIHGTTGEVPLYPALDLNDAAQRSAALSFGVFLLAFVMVSSVGSYKAYEYTDSVQFCGLTCHTVMHPQYTAHQLSAHARVTCAECHVGSGASWYVKSKFSGARQVFAAAFNTYPRPIPTPVHNLRPAQDTCEQCHWPRKFYGAQLKVFTHYSSDEKNTPRQVRLLIKTGGGDPATGAPEGIHWHMNIANQIDYVAATTNGR